jgi:hypothetical protein
MEQSMSGMRPAEGSDITAGKRDYEITIVREFADDPIEVMQLFNGISETFDPTEAVEFTIEGDPETLHRVRVGDVIQMRVVVNT